MDNIFLIRGFNYTPWRLKYSLFGNYQETHLTQIKNGWLMKIISQVA